MKFTKLIPVIGIISTGFVLSTTSVSAATIFDNGTLASGAGSPSDPDLPTIRADDFSLTGLDTTIRSIHWRGKLTGGTSYAQTYEVDNFTLRIYADSSGPTGAPLHEFMVGSSVNRIGTGLISAGADVFDYSADITATTLTAGTTYWLSIFNDTTADTDDIWAWVYANNAFTSGNNSYGSATDGATWLGNTIVDFSFRLDNAAVSAVPVPAAVWLMGSALAGLFGFSHRKSTTT
jgi:hypothetical protein